MQHCTFATSLHCKSEAMLVQDALCRLQIVELCRGRDRGSRHDGQPLKQRRGGMAGRGSGGGGGSSPAHFTSRCNFPVHCAPAARPYCCPATGRNGPLRECSNSPFPPGERVSISGTSPQLPPLSSSLPPSHPHQQPGASAASEHPRAGHPATPSRTRSPASFLVGPPLSIRIA